MGDYPELDLFNECNEDDEVAGGTAVLRASVSDVVDG